LSDVRRAFIFQQEQRHAQSALIGINQQCSQQLTTVLTSVNENRFEPVGHQQALLMCVKAGQSPTVQSASGQLK